MKNYNFKYFDNPLENAEFEEESCELCGSNDDCLSGAYIDSSDGEFESVCLECIMKGNVKISFPNHIHKRIYEELKRLHESLTEEEIKVIKDKMLEELTKTPPVPWVQYNDWPVCCGDFMKYIGEWQREDFIDNSEDGDGKNYLLSLLDEETKRRIDSLDGLWDEIGEETIAFVFGCKDCKRNLVILQSY